MAVRGDGFLIAVIAALAASALGLGALLLAIPRLFDAIRYAGRGLSGVAGRRGAARRRQGGVGLDPDVLIAALPMPARRLYVDALLTGLSNPKLILFAAAFCLQFSTGTAPTLPQFAILVATFAAIETGWYGVYAGGGRRLANSPRRQRVFDRGTGALFVAFGAGLAAVRV